MTWLRGLALSGLTCALSACASTDQGQRTVGQTTTNLASTTASLEKESERVEEYIQRSGFRIRDAALESYVRGLVDKSAGDFQEEVDVYLLEAPVFNAFMLPNGVMAVNSGLMLRAETEGELALVLGHEFGHYYENHSLERHAAASNANTVLTALGVTAAGVWSATGTYVNPNLLGTAIIAGYFSFNRTQESEADTIGLERAAETGYDTTQAIRLWENLEKEKEASSIRAIRKRHSSIYDTHPTTEKRLAALKEAANVQGEIERGSLAQRRAYRARIRSHLLEWLNDEIELRDAGATLNLLDRLDGVGEDQGVLLYARARVVDRALTNKTLLKDKGTRGLMEGKSPETVVSLLKESASYPDAPAVVYRDLGDRLFKMEQYAESTAAFQRYLNSVPNAEDASLITSLIEKMKGQS